VYAGESGLDSAFGFALKAVMRKFLQKLIDAIITPGEEAGGYRPKK
jgi:hypothetical protein